jgi:uncharacterized membrane protein
VVFVYQCYVDEKLSDRKDVGIVSVNQKTDDFVIDADTTEVSQVFTAKHNNLSVLYYKLQVEDVDNDAKLHVVVYGEESENVYHDDYVSVKNLDDELVVLLQKEFESSNKQQVKVVMEPVDFGDTKIIFQSGLCRTNVECYSNGEETNVAPALTASYSNNDFLKVLYAIYVIAIYLFLVMVYVLFIVKRVSVEQAFIPVVLSLGILYMFAIPIYSVPDEYVHADTAYAISNQILGVQESEKTGYIYKRECDIETGMVGEVKAKVSSYRRIYTSLFSKTDREELTECYSKSSLGNASVIFYLPAAIGISIGRMLHWGSFPMLMFGRFCNLLTYVLLTYWAMRKAVFGKKLLFIVSTLSIVLQESASFSYDGMINAFVFVMLSYCFYMMEKENKIKTIDVAVLLFLIMQMAYVKGGVYLPLCFLVVLIPYERGWKLKGKVRYYVGIIVLILASFLKNNIIGIIKRLQAVQGSNINGFNGGEMYTFGYLLHHPFKLVSLYVNTIFVEGDAYFQGVFGGELGVSQLYMPWFTVIVTFLVLIFLSIDKEQRMILKKGFSRVWIGLMFVGSALLVCLSMLVAFTTTDYNYIEGVQGRYFIPIILLPFILLANKKGKTLKTDNNKIIGVYLLNHVIECLYILMMVFK